MQNTQMMKKATIIVRKLIVRLFVFSLLLIKLWKYGCPALGTVLSASTRPCAISLHQALCYQPALSTVLSASTQPSSSTRHCAISQHSALCYQPTLGIVLTAYTRHCAIIQHQALHPASTQRCRQVKYIYFFQVDKIEDKVQECMKLFEKMKTENITDKERNDYKKRKLIQEM